MTRCPQCGQPVHPATTVCPRCGQRMTPAAPPPQYADADPNVPPWLQQLQADQPPPPYAPTAGNTARVPAPQPGMNPQQPPSYQQGWPGGDPNGGMPAPRGNGNAGWGPPPGPGMGQRPDDRGYQAGPQPGQQGGGRMNGGPLFDESALPEWLRQQPEMPQSPPPPQSMPGQARPQPMGGANAFPPIEQAGQYQPGPPAAGGMPGHALLDSSALSQWAGGQAVGPAQQRYGNGMPANDGLPAQSLVDEQALPQWLRAQPNNEAALQAPNSGVPRWIANPSGNEAPPSWVAQPFADAQAAPAPGAAAPWQGGPMGQPPANPPYGQDVPGGRMSASQFVDESALPEWLQVQGGGQGGQPGRPAAGGNGGGQPWAPQQQPLRAQPSVPPQAPGPQDHFAASDLVDPSAMPQWARAGEAAPTFDSANGWANPQRPSAPGEPAKPDAYGRSSIQRGANGNGGRRGSVPPMQRPDPLESTELPSWLQDPRGQQYAPPQQQQGYGASDGYDDYDGYSGNAWDEPQGQWDEADQYGSYDDQQDPYGGPVGRRDDPYGRDDYPNRPSYVRSQPGQRQAQPPDPRGSGGKDKGKPRGWRAIFRRK